MKMFLALIMCSLMTISNVKAQQDDPAIQATASVSGAASWIALSVYAPEVAAGLIGTTAVGYTTMSLALTDLANNGLVVKNAVNADAQEFFNSGKLTEALSQTIKLVKKNNLELSDAEALDLIIKSVNQ
jgi:hypothetical protein